MENEHRHYGLRSGSRSRSQTPLIQNRALVESEILEHHYDLRSRSKERSRTPGEVPNTRRSVSKMSLGNNSKMNDQNMETITEKRKDTVTVDSLSEGETKKIEDFSAGIKRVERRSERQKAKKQIFSNGQTDTKEHSSGRMNEESRKSISPRRIITSDYSSEEEITNRPNSAHEIYKQAGDWWNVFPKTDYTYSERSQCRYEIAPGILAMPNMSRRSIHSDASGTFESTNIEKEGEANADICTSVDNVHGSCTLNADGKSKIQYRKTHVEQYRCHRETIYTVPKSLMNSQTSRSSGSDSQSKCMHSRKHDVTSCADSDTELDEAISSKSTRETKIRGRLRNFVSVIVLWLSKLLEFLKLRAVKRREYHTPYEYQRYESRWYKMWRLIDRCLQYVYLFMVKIFFFDSWLLSRVSRIRSWMHQRSPKVFWIGLLPLLLLTGCWCLPYFSTLFLSSKVLTRQLRDTTELLTADKQSYLKEEKSFGIIDDTRSIGEKLNSKVDGIEDQSVKQSDRLVNINQALGQLKESEYVWSRYSNEILLLEKKLEEYSRHTTELNVYAEKVEDMKLHFVTLKELYSKLRSCCNRKYVTEDDLEKRIEATLADYMDNKGFRDKTVGRGREDEVEERLSLTGKNIVSDDRVREIVKEALRVYDADKTGRVDYALESAGGQIISTRCTQKYDIKTRAFKLLALTLYHENNNPRTVIQGNPIQPGICWAFQGFPGYLLIKLRNSIFVTGFTVEHAAKSILPNGEMRSAPKKFNVWGFIDENDSTPVMFGDYEFAASDESLQYFPVQNATIERPYEYVELRIHSNHGQLEYTCLYRFRVHGRPV